MKYIFYLLFIIVVSITLYGIATLATYGGPCNAGIALIVLYPQLILSSFFQILMFERRNDRLKAFSIFVIIVTIGLFASWLKYSYIFWLDYPKESLLYLTPFAILNVITLSLFIYFQLYKRESNYEEE